MDLSDFPNLEDKKQTVEKKEAEETRDRKKCPQTITITTTKEIFSNKDKTKKIEKVTVETEISTQLPDGTTEIKKETKVSASEIGRETPESHLEGFKPVGDPKVETTKNNETVKDGNKTIKRIVTVNTTTQEYQDANGKKKLKQVVKTTTEDEQPDGSVATSVKEATSIMCEHVASPSK